MCLTKKIKTQVMIRNTGIIWNYERKLQRERHGGMDKKGAPRTAGETKYHKRMERDVKRVEQRERRRRRGSEDGLDLWRGFLFLQKILQS